MAETVGIPLDRRTLVMQLADALRDAILQGKFELGAELQEARLSDEFRVGRGTLREALQLLYAEGLIEKEPRKAWRVRKSSDKAAWEVVTLRATLEGLAAHLAAQQMTAASTQQLQSIIADMESAAASGDTEGVNAADFRFHRTVVELSDNEVLLRMWLTIRGYSWLLLANSPRKDLYPPSERVRLHRQLLDALCSGSPDRAEQAFKQQIYETAAVPGFASLPKPWSAAAPA